MKVSVNCKVENGTIATNRRTLANAFKEFDGKEVTVTIERKRKKRSNNQNAYLWGCVYPILKLAFYETWGEVRSIEEIHEWAKLQFNYTEKVNQETGEIARIPKSTTINSTIQQEEFHEEIRRFAREWFNTEIPLPNEAIEMNFNN